ncbi:11577_t:CDS:2 [Entrophospora sp. SA101]|nr:12473_t:CDS:2 [Entrophospora sp. SA101]CAJ0828026.1 11577_t:CDS:2 [Entrophospora sp. SA101]CAJ0843583.1 6083_t:CDS:2 [Entrophospora sp. SA101]
MNFNLFRFSSYVSVGGKDNDKNDEYDLFSSETQIKRKLEYGEDEYYYGNNDTLTNHDTSVLSQLLSNPAHNISTLSSIITNATDINPGINYQNIVEDNTVMQNKERNVDNRYYTDWDCLNTHWKYCKENKLTYSLFGFLIYAVVTSSVNIEDDNLEFNLYNLYKHDHNGKQPIQKMRDFETEKGNIDVQLFWEVVKKAKSNEYILFAMYIERMVKRLDYENLLLKYQSSEIGEIEMSIEIVSMIQGSSLRNIDELFISGIIDLTHMPTKINDHLIKVNLLDELLLANENMAEIPSDLLEYVKKYISSNQRYEIPSELNEKEFGLYRAARKLCESFMDLKLKEQYKKDNYIYESTWSHGTLDNVKNFILHDLNELYYQW